MNIYTVSFLLIILFNFIKNKRCMHALQLSLYNENNRYLKWIIDNYKEAFMQSDLISMIIVLIAYIINNQLSEILLVIALIFYFLDSAYIINNRNKRNFKKPFIVIKSVRRQIVTTSILFILPIIIYILNNEHGLLVILIESIITYLSYLVVLLAYYINVPIEKLIQKYYKIKALDKLKTIPNLRPIFITGSYGKTSSKAILNDILRIKYNVSKTPRDLNTEYGLTLTINNHLTRNDEIFITDVGGYKQGEISKLCRMLKPKYGIITNIGITDLDAFGNSENILKTRFELIEELPSDGIAVLNMDDNKQLSYNIKNKCKKIWIGIKNKDADIIAKDIECNQYGSKFNVVFKGDKEKYPFETKLLGNYNIYNILASIALGRELGITIEELQETIKTVRQIEGRLELKDFKYMYQLDNTYNTNPIGAKVGLDVLELMPGKKIVVTDGINPTIAYVKEKEINHIYGNQISKLKPDMVILVGERQTKHIFKGLLENGYDKDNIYVVREMNDAYNLIQKYKSREKVYALFE